MTSWSTRAVFAGAALFGKLYSSVLARRVTIHHPERLLAAIHRPPGRPLLTISNHTSPVDDPLIWAAAIPLPKLLSLCLSSKSGCKRWTLGAEEICFTNPLYRTLMASGRVIPVRRGDGVYQPAVDRALDRLSRGDWVHVFVEGKIGATPGQLVTPIQWGVGRLVMESSPPPIILPIIHLGIEKMVGFGRAVPRRCELDVRMGPLIDGGLLQQALPAGNTNVLRAAVTDYLEERLADLYELDNPSIEWNMHKHMNTHEM